MALSQFGTWEARATGSDLNAGYFNPAASGVDYSQQDAPQLALSDISTNGTTTVSSASGGFTASMVGNGLNILGTAVYEITGYTNSNTVTVDRAVTAGSLQTGRVGGALATANKVNSFQVAGNQAWFQGVVSVTAAMTISVSGTGLSTAINGDVLWRGYGSTRGDAVKATLRATGFASATFLALTGQHIVIKNLDLDGNNLTGLRAIQGANQWLYVRNCTIRNFKNGGVWSVQEVIGNTFSNISGASGVDNCQRIYNNTSTGQNGGEAAFHARTGLAENNTAYGSNTSGFQTDSGGELLFNRAVACATGVSSAIGIPKPGNVEGNIVWGSTARNFSLATLPGDALGWNAGGGGLGPDLNPYNLVTLTSNPFVGAANGDWRLNPDAALALWAGGVPFRTDWLIAPPVRRWVKG